MELCWNSTQSSLCLTQLSLRPSHVFLSLRSCMGCVCMLIWVGVLVCKKSTNWTVLIFPTVAHLYLGLTAFILGRWDHPQPPSLSHHNDHRFHQHSTKASSHNYTHCRQHRSTPKTSKSKTKLFSVVGEGRRWPCKNPPRSRPATVN